MRGWSAGDIDGRIRDGSEPHLTGWFSRLPRFIGSRKGAHTLAGNALPEDHKGLTELRLGASYRDVAVDGLTIRESESVLENEHGDPCARNVGDLFKASALPPDNVTDERVRDHDGHFESRGGVSSLRREFLSEGQGEGVDGGNGGRLPSRGAFTRHFSFQFRSLSGLFGGRGERRRLRMDPILLSRWVPRGGGGGTNALLESSEGQPESLDRCREVGHRVLDEIWTS